MKNFYITTPIYYVNALPHIGHAYATILCDTAARYHRDILKEDTFFLTGTDENSQKNVEAAEEAGKETKEYVDEMSERWNKVWQDLGLTNDSFIRTTSEEHKKGVDKFFKKVWDKGDIYKSTYEGLYCVGCEAFYSEADAENGECPAHKRKLETLKEDNYFFKLTKYKEPLLQYIKEHPEFVTPEARRNEVVSYIENFMEDVSISRSTMKWGIPVPTDESQVIYVWFDALINYLTGIGYGTDEEKFKTYWPSAVHLIGKDILKFHAALWPAMLMAADISLPKQILATGFFTVDGEKMSKSLGNVINPVAAAERHGVEPLRYYLLTAIPFGSDGDVSMDKYEELYNADLRNGIGNLVSRVIAMTEKYAGGKVPATTGEGVYGLISADEIVKDRIENFQFHDLIQSIQSVVGIVNTLINDEKPWELAKSGEKEKVDTVLNRSLNQIRHIAWALYPIMPETSKEIFSKLGLDVEKELTQQISDIKSLEVGSMVSKGDNLFT